MKNQAKKGEEAPILRFLWSRFWPHRKWLFISAAFASVAAYVQIRTATLVKSFMDDAFIPQNWTLLVHLCLMLVGLFFLDGFTDFFHRFTLRIGTERTVRSLRREIFERFLILSPEQSARASTGQATTHILSDTFIISQGLHVVADVLREPLILLGLLGYLFYLNVRLTLICFFAIPVLILIGRALGKSARRNQSRIQGTLDKITNHIQETLGGLRTAHAFHQTSKLREEFHAETDRSYRWLVRLARVEETVAPLTKWFTSWIGAGLILLEGYFVIHEKSMTVGDAIAFITAAGLLQQPLRQLNQVNVRLQTVIAAGQRLYELLHSPLDPISKAQQRLVATPPPSSIPREPLPLEFKAVTYSYPVAQESEKRPVALRDISLTIHPGQRIALVGRSGSGKTTTSLLAMRFLDPSQGEVLFGGRAARDWELGDYRSHFAYVSQEVYLFHRSLRENMLFAAPKAADAEIWASLEKAGIRDFVEKLPQKLDTNLSQQAANLSGGERQRLAIARAFLRNAPVLILDEATSQLDAHSEDIVQRALAELMQNRSVLVIAHRLATVRAMDEVAVFDHGTILEQGAPDALLAKPDGAFAGLWRAQVGSGSKTI